MRQTEILSGIYKIENLINGKIYIGQSIDIYNRFYQHQHTKDKYYLHRAIQKDGIKNFDFSILEKNLFSKENRNEREKYWIQYYNSIAPNGYNLTKGGDCIAECLKKPVNQYSLEGIFIQTFESQSEAARILNISTPGHISLVCNYMMHMAGGFIWRFTDDENEVQPYSLGRTICQYTLNGDYIQTFDNAAAAAKILNIDRANITATCRYRVKSAGDFIWRYEEDNNIIIPVKPKGKRIKQYDIQNKQLIAEYKSISEAARALNVYPSNMTQGIHKPNKIYKNYYWEVEE